MIAYKLFRQLRSGDITSLFINKSRKLPENTWMKSENIPTKGFAIRPGWHCTAEPNALHLKMELKSGEKRVWRKVEIKNYRIEHRPEYQGGKWYLASEIKILNDN